MKKIQISIYLLMEADLLDDTGALGIILDIMVEHAKILIVILKIVISIFMIILLG